VRVSGGCRWLRIDAAHRAGIDIHEQQLIATAADRVLHQQRTIRAGPGQHLPGAGIAARDESRSGARARIKHVEVASFARAQRGAEGDPPAIVRPDRRARVRRGLHQQLRRSAVERIEPQRGIIAAARLRAARQRRDPVVVERLRGRSAQLQDRGAQRLWLRWRAVPALQLLPPALARGHQQAAVAEPIEQPRLAAAAEGRHAGA
jgi:hypothetical protein